MPTPHNITSHLLDNNKAIPKDHSWQLNNIERFFVEEISMPLIDSRLQASENFGWGRLGGGGMWGNVAEAPGKPLSPSGHRLARVLWIHYLSKVLLNAGQHTSEILLLCGFSALITSFSLRPGRNVVSSLLAFSCCLKSIEGEQLKLESEFLGYDS